MATHPPRGVGRARRAIATAAAVAGATLTFALSTVAAVVIHLDTPVMRRVVTAQVNRSLAGSFKGTVRIQRIGHIGFDGVRGVDAEVLDPAGKRVLLAQDVRANIPALGVAWSAVTGKGALEIPLSQVRIAYVEVALDQDQNGELGISHAFDAKTISPATPGPSRATVIHIPRAEIAHAWVHGNIGLPLIDVDLDALRADVAVDPGATVIDVTRVAVVGRSFPNGANPAGDVTGSLSIPDDAAVGLSARATYAGQVGGARIVASGSMTGKTVQATVDVPRTDPAIVRSLAPGAPIFQPVDAHVEASGTLPDVSAKVHLGVGAGTVDVDAAAKLESAIHATVKAVVTNVDPRAFSETAPAAAISAKLDAALDRSAGGALSGRADLSTERTQMSGQMIPAAEVHATFTDTTVAGSAVVHEPGAPTAIRFDLHGSPGKPADRVVVFDTTTEVANLMAISRVGPISQGSAHVHTKGQLALTGPTLTVSVDASLSHVKKGEIALDRALVTATARGPVDNLVFDATVRGEGLRANKYFFAKATVTAHGPVASPFVTAKLEGDDKTPSVNLRAGLSTRGGFAVQGADVSVRRGETTMVAHIPTLRAGGGVVDVRGLVVEGLGKPVQADVHLAPGVLSIKARAEDVDMMRIAELFEIDKPKGGEIQGMASFDVDVTYSKKDAQGRVTASLRDVVVHGIKGAGGDVDVRVEGRHVTAVVAARFGESGHLNLTSNVALGGSLLEPSSWVKATGDAKIDGDVDLEKLLVELPPDTIPVDKAAGHVVVAGTITRSNTSTLPDVDMSILTEHLDVIGRSPAPTETKTLVVRHEDAAVVEARAIAARQEPTAGDGVPTQNLSPAATPRTDAQPPTSEKPIPKVAGVAQPDRPVTVPEPTVAPWHTKDLDAKVSFKIDGARDHQTVVASVFDINGNVVEAKLDADAPLARLIAHPETVQMTMATAPVLVHLSVPKRQVHELPLIVRPSGVRGSIELAADFRGSLAAPDLDLHAIATGLEPIGNPAALAFDADARVRYDGKHGGARIKMLRPEGVVLDSDTTVELPLLDILQGKKPSWTASSETKLASFPLHTLGGLLDEPVEGCVTGTVRVKDLHTQGSAAVDLTVANLHLGEAVFPRGTVKVDLSSGHLTADARLEQGDGYIETHARGAMKWGAELAPMLDPNAPVEVDLKADDFRLAAVLPFVQSQVSEIDGRLDADLHAKATGGDLKNSHVEGFIQVDKGRFEATALGQEFHDLHARVTVTPAGLVTVSDLKMKGVTGELDGTASAQLDGVALKSADGELTIPEKHKLPITVQGVSYGQAWGNLKVHAETARAGKDLTISVDIPSLHTDLPESATHSVQDLDDEATIRIGVSRPGVGDEKRFVLLAMHPVQATPSTPSTTAPAPDDAGGAPGATRIAVKLGQDVRLTRGTQVDVYIAGDPTIELAGGRTRMTGKLNLQRGRLDVFGKRFTIENGTVAFNPNDAANPQIVVTAEWEAPDGTKVFADYAGLVKNGRLTLRSDPAHTQDEIVSLILFGSADGSLGAAPPGGDQGNAGKAAGLGGGVATQGINKALANLTDIDVQTRVDTTDSQNPRPELAIQLSRRVMAEVAYNLGLPAPGQNPDRALLIFGYRFSARWSLQTTFGDAGSSLADLIWQYRY